MGPNTLVYAVIATVVVSLGTLVWVLFDQRKQRLLYEERKEAYEKEQAELEAERARKEAERERARAAAEAAGIPFVEENEESAGESEETTIAASESAEEPK